MKIPIFIIFLTFSNLVVSFEKGCSITYLYEPGKKPSNLAHGGTTDYSTTRDEFIYFICRKNCNELRPQVDYIKGVKSCEISGVPIEESEYKDIFLKNKENICYVQVKEKHSYNLYMARDDSECKAFMKEFYWCKNDEECSYTYGLD